MPWVGDVHVCIRGPVMKYTCNTPGEELTNWGKLSDLLDAMQKRGITRVSVCSFKNGRQIWQRLYFGREGKSRYLWNWSRVYRG